MAKQKVARTTSEIGREVGIELSEDHPPQIPESIIRFDFVAEEYAQSELQGCKRLSCADLQLRAMPCLEYVRAAINKTGKNGTLEIACAVTGEGYGHALDDLLETHCKEIAKIIESGSNPQSVCGEQDGTLEHGSFTISVRLNFIEARVDSTTESLSRGGSHGTVCDREVTPRLELKPTDTQQHHLDELRKTLSTDPQERRKEIQVLCEALNSEIEVKKELPSPQDFARLILSGLPEDKADYLIQLAGRLDEYRKAMRSGLEKAIQEYITGRNPEKKEGRQRSLDIINGLIDRLGFALEHPDHPGKKCYLVLSSGRTNPQGQIRLLPKGSTTTPLLRNAHLSTFASVRIVDAAASLEFRETETGPGESASWADLAQRTTSGRSGGTSHE